MSKKKITHYLWLHERKRDGEWKSPVIYMCVREGERESEKKLFSALFSLNAIFRIMMQMMRIMSIVMMMTLPVGGRTTEADNEPMLLMMASARIIQIWTYELLLNLSLLFFSPCKMIWNRCDKHYEQANFHTKLYSFARCMYIICMYASCLLLSFFFFCDNCGTGYWE